jgi:hypothetical protein
LPWYNLLRRTGKKKMCFYSKEYRIPDLLSTAVATKITYRARCRYYTLARELSGVRICRYTNTSAGNAERNSNLSGESLIMMTRLPALYAVKRLLKE